MLSLKLKNIESKSKEKKLNNSMMKMSSSRCNRIPGKLSSKPRVNVPDLYNISLHCAAENREKLIEKIHVIAFNCFKNKLY